MAMIPIPYLIPDLIYDIPEDMAPTECRHMAAQIAIQAVIHTMGSKEVQPGHAAMGSQELERVLALSVAMLVAADPSLKTRQDVREAAQERSKMLEAFAEILCEEQDMTGRQIMDVLGFGRIILNYDGSWALCGD